MEAEKGFGYWLTLEKAKNSSKWFAMESQTPTVYQKEANSLQLQVKCITTPIGRKSVPAWGRFPPSLLFGFSLVDVQVFGLIRLRGPSTQSTGIKQKKHSNLS